VQEEKFRSAIQQKEKNPPKPMKAPYSLMIDPETMCIAQSILLFIGIF
jgi:hypothetical protein